MTIVLHAIAAIIWLFALWISAAVGMTAKEGDERKMLVGLIVVAVASAIAFALQVMA